MKWVAFTSPGDLPDPGIKPGCPALWAHFLPFDHQGSPLSTYTWPDFLLDFLRPQK